jgi:2'-5' RNA ligase
MRCFAALDFDEKTLDAILQVQGRIEQILLNSESLEAKAIPKNQMHLTLVFFPDEREREINDKVLAFKNLFAKRKSFNFKLGKVVFLPSIGAAKVIALEVESPELMALQKELATALNSKEKRDFKAHLTLFRIKSGIIKSSGQILGVGYDAAASIEGVAAKFSFKKSTLYSSGPVYENLAVVNL